MITGDSTLTVTGVTKGTVSITATATDPGGLSAQHVFETTVEPLSDRDVLEALYHATGGPNWTRSDNWLNDRVAPGLWWGVEVDENYRVKKLDLWGNNLTGPIPPEIGRLTSLQTLNLIGNKLTGPIPPEIGRLRNLRTLWLIRNHLTGPIPPEIGNLTNLQDLRLSLNHLSGLIPPQIGNLSSLVELSLGALGGNNRFSGPIPPEIGNLGKLEQLTLDRFVGGPIPAEIGNLHSLKRLRCQRCSLSGTIPPEIGNLRNLTHLIISWIGGPIPPEIGNLTSLQYLQLAGSLTGPIPPEIGNLTSLTTAGIGGNLTGPIPAEIGNLTSLTSFGLVGNNLTGPIPAEIGRLTSLTSLGLSGNNLTGPIPAEIGRLTALRSLSLGSNSFDGPIPPEIGNLTSLTSLWLGENDLTGPVPPEIGRLEDLTRLHLTKNAGMSGPLPGAMAALGQLHSLFAGGTDLCAPLDADFQSWFRGVRVRRAATCRMGGSSAAYLTQAVQSLRFPVPLVAGEQALLRVFVTAEDARRERIPPVRATFYLDGAVAHVEQIPQAAGQIPSEVYEGDLQASTNATIPAEVIQPGLEMVIEIDPGSTVDPSLELTRRIPAEGRLAVDVRAMPPLDLTLIPFLWNTSPDSAILSLTQAMAADPGGHELLWATRTLLPIAAVDVKPHALVLTSSNHAQTLAEETRAIRVMEGSTDLHIGMMSGTVEGSSFGTAYARWCESRSGFSVPRSEALAHAVGHHVGLRHAPCGGAFDPDLFFPTADGSIGAWGYDFRDGGKLVPPSQADIMSICTPSWISDYYFANALTYRLLHETSPDPPAASPVKSLLLWGGVDEGGKPYLQPAFVVLGPEHIAIVIVHR